MSGDIPDLSSDEEYQEEDQWVEMDTEDNRVNCIFCDKRFSNIDKAIEHSDSDHSFNLVNLLKRFKMDCYSYIKLINYIRAHSAQASMIMESKTELWSDEKYLKPVVCDEWLTYDFESLSVPHNTDGDSSDTFQEQFIVERLKRELEEKEKVIQLAKEDMDKMRVSMKHVIDGVHNEPVDSASKVSPEEDEGYFNSYAHFGIHYEMLSDKVRTESYQNAILSNADIFQDKLVLDLGCGTGILSLFAAKSGAKEVFAVDMSDIVYHAIDIVKENNLNDTIKVIKGKLENIDLGSVDIIISEWMGYFLLFEGMLDSVIYAREHHLKAGGLLLPNRCTISLVANGDNEMHNKLIGFWSDVYGFKMNCMKSEVVREASVDVIDNKHILSKPYVIKEVDISTCGIDVMDFVSEFELEILTDGSLTSLVGYFDTFFDLPTRISFSTGPHCTPTHWKQTVFYFKECTPVKQGQVISGKIRCNRDKSNVRSLTVEIELFGRKSNFILS